MEVILCQLEAMLPKYGGKQLFVCFEVCFTVLAVLFLNIRGYFVSILGVFAKIQAKTFIRLF